MILINLQPGLSQEEQVSITRPDPLEPAAGDLFGYQMRIPVSNDVFTDLGAVLVDDPQESLLVTSHLFLAGEAGFRTMTRSHVNIPRAHPTRPGQPWLVRYSVREDDSWPWRDLATPQIREIIVACPEGEKVCEDDESSGSTFCSVEGLCVALSEAEEVDLNAERYPPVISLNGLEEVVQIDAGTPYDICPLDGSASSIQCEPGAEAFDIVGSATGNKSIDLQEEVKMSCRFTPAAGDEAESLGPLTEYSRGLAACGFSTLRPGRWSIIFQVRNSAGFTSEVEKAISIVAVCPTGEVLCDAGVCAESPAQCALFQGSSGAGSGSVTSASGQEDSEDEDLAPAPWIGLRDVPGIEQSGAIIRIPEGLSFIGCNEDGAAEICEPGADAKDETGDVRERVWACPESPLMPANCLTNPSACPFDEYGFEAAGLRYCQIDVPDGQDGFVAGDSFEIRFVILAHNGRVSEARRFVTFTRRCPSDDQPFYCNAPELGKPEYQCVALECEQWRAIGAPETNGEMGAPVFSSSLAASPSDNLVSLAGGAGRRLLQERHLLQQGSGKEEVPVETVTTELAYFYEAGSVPDGLYWKNRPLAPCQPESGPESACDIAAFDARGASVRISAAPVCTDQFSAYPSYEEFLAAVKSSAALEAATDELCQAKLCSPSSADRGQCRPGKYIIQYEASDTGERRSIMNLVFRVENGARHIVQVIGAVLCGLKQMVSTGQLVLDGAPYLKAAGLRLDSVRQVDLLGDGVTINEDPIHPGNADTPPLCEALFQMELQVGCIPGEDGFTVGPQPGENAEQWCPCTINWDPAYMGAGRPIDPTKSYPIVEGENGRPLYGPLISVSQIWPTGALADAPLPTCIPVTTPSNSSEALLSHDGAAALSFLEDSSYNLMAHLDRLASTTVVFTDIHVQVGDAIEDKWESLVQLFAELTDSDQDSLDLLLEQQQLQDFSDADRALSAVVNAGRNAVNTERGMAEAGRESWFDASKTSASIDLCVESERGGTFPYFNFFVGVREGTRRVLSRRVLLSSDDWNGYPVQMEGTTKPVDPDAGDPESLYTVDRPVGIDGNQVLAGGMFMQERRMPTDLARGGSRFSSVCEGGILAAKLAAECLELHTASAEADLAYWDKQEADNPTGRKWIGVDPAFIPSSPLFNPSIANAPWGWYNTSLGSADLNRNGVPRGFESFPGGLPGLPNDRAPVFPVVVDVNAGSKQARHTLNFMKEGRYFSRTATTRMLFKIASFNADLQLFGYLVADAHWDDAGQVQVFFDIQALEAKDYTPDGLVMEGMWSRLVNDVVLLFFVVAYTITTIRDIIMSLQAQKKRKHTWLALQNARQAARNSWHVGSSSSSSSSSGRSGRFNSLSESSNACDEMLVKEETDSDDSFDDLPETNLRLDNTQVNDHPISKQKMRFIRLNRRDPRQQRDLARSSMGSETSCSRLINPNGSQAARVFHGMKRLMQQPVHKIYRASKSPFWISFDIVVSLTLLFGLGLTLYYAFGLQPEDAPTERRFQVYDFLYASARPFLLSRLEPDRNATDLAMQPTMNVREPGQFGRWETGTEDARGLVEMAQMFNKLDKMVTVRTAYTLIFGAAMVLLLVGLMVQVSFQPRLSLIAGTLVLGAAEICNFVFIATVLCAMLAMAQNIIFGADSRSMSTLSGSMKLLFEGLVLGDQKTGDSKEAKAFLQEESVVQLHYSPSFIFDTNLGLMALAATIISVRPLIFMFLLVMVMTTLAIPYAMLRAGSSAAPGVHTDVFNLLSWMWKIVADKEPDNRALKRLLKSLLKEGRGKMQDQPFQRLPPLLKLLSRPRRQSETPPSSRSLGQVPEIRKVEARRSVDFLDWSHLHSVLMGEVEGAPRTSSINGSGRGPSTGENSMESAAAEAGMTGRAMPKASLSKSAQLKVWVAGLRRSKRNSESASAPGHEQAPTTNHCGDTGNDVELGALKQARIGELASATVDKALHQANAVEKATGSGHSPFRDIDFTAAKKQIAGLLALQEDQREQASKLAQRMSIMFSASTEAISTKTNFVNHAQQASQTELVRVQRQDAYLWQRTGNADHSHWNPAFSQAPPVPALPPSSTSGQDDVPWDNSTELENAVFDADLDKADGCLAPSFITVELQSASQHYSWRHSASQHHSTTAGQVSSFEGLDKPAATEIPSSPAAANLVEELVNLTLEANLALREVQASCAACVHLANSVQALLCKITEKEARTTPRRKSGDNSL